MNKKVMILIGGFIAVLVLTVLLVFINKDDKKYTVTFNTDGGTMVESVEVSKGKTLEIPKEPKKEGYIFIGWTLNGKAFDFNTSVNSDIVLKAEWKKLDSNKKTYVVKFDTDGGTSILNQVVEEGSKVVKPSNPEKEGYTFKGWYLDEKEYDFSLSVTNDIVLKAVYEKKENAQTNTAVNNNQNSNNKTNSSQTNTSSSNSSNPTPAPAPVVVQNYTVTFNSNGGSAVASQTVSGGSRATQPSNPTREGYSFSGWTLNGTAYNFASAVNSNINLVATWSPKTYVVKVTLIDSYSPDRILTVYENGTPITVSSIKYTDGYTLCSGSNTTVNKNDIEGETSLLVVLSGGTQVTASVS